MHGRPRIGAESSFTPTLSSIGYLGVGRVRLSSRQGEFIRYSAREPSLPLGWARLLQPLYLMPALSETRMGVVVTRIFHSNPRHSITLHSSTVYRDEMQFSSGQDSREFWIDRGLRLFKVYLHPRIIGRRTSFVSISLFLLLFLFEKRNYSATFCVHRCILAVSTERYNNSLGSFEPTPSSWVN